MLEQKLKHQQADDDSRFSGMAMKNNITPASQLLNNQVKVEPSPKRNPVHDKAQEEARRLKELEDARRQAYLDKKRIEAKMAENNAEIAAADQRKQEEDLRRK